MIAELSVFWQMLLQNSATKTLPLAVFTMQHSTSAERFNLFSKNKTVVFFYSLLRPLWKFRQMERLINDWLTWSCFCKSAALCWICWLFVPAGISAAAAADDDDANDVGWVTGWLTGLCTASAGPTDGWVSCNSL